MAAEDDQPPSTQSFSNFSKWKWIATELDKRSNEFTERKDITIACGTWNVNAKKPEPEDNLLKWLLKRGGEGPDFFFIGFQEIVDLNAVNVVADRGTRERAAVWSERLSQAVNSIPGSSYQLVHEKHLVGIMVCIYAKVEHVKYIKRVQSQTAGVGVMGMMGNKGGAAIRLKCYDTTICLVAAHLAAHRDNVAGRNADFANILQRIQFVHQPLDEVEKEELGKLSKLTEFEETSNYSSDESTGQLTFGIMDHEFVFFIGDFNYRIVEGISTEEVFEKVEKEEFAWLRENDQLNVERRLGNVFQAFNEGLGDNVPPFAPTYKYQPKTSIYEKRPDKKLRAPAWCDRILWHAKNEERVSQLSYDSTMELEISDHKPVSAEFRMACKEVDLGKKQQVYDETDKRLNRYVNDSVPKVELNEKTVNFGSVRYMVETSWSVRLLNTGQVIAHWRFKTRPEETNICKKWLRVEPTYGMLIPGEHTDIALTALIDNETAVAITAGTESLDDIMVLHLENGPDYFVNVCGDYARSCFGCSLEELICANEPIRELPLVYSSEGLRRHFSPKQDSSRKPLSVPKELWRLVDAIYLKGLKERNIFLTQGNPSEVEKIRECLDTNTEFDQCSVHSYADALSQFLKSLAEPVVPLSLFPTMEIDAQSLQPWSRRFLEKLPSVNYNCFVYIISFFRELLVHSESNRLTATKLAIVAVNCMAACKPEHEEKELQGKHSLQHVISYFLTTAML